MYTKTTFEQLNNAGRYAVEFIRRDKSDYKQKQFKSLFRHSLPKFERQNSPYCNTTDELTHDIANALSRARYFRDFIKFECYAAEVDKWSKGDNFFKIDFDTFVSVKNYFATELVHSYIIAKNN